LTIKTVYVDGAGIISSLGSGAAATEKTLRENRSAIKPLRLFSLLHGSPLPVGQVAGLNQPSSLPRTHRLALLAAEQAMAHAGVPPDAVIIGTTTGGIATTEQLLRNHEHTKTLYRYHGLTTVAHALARALHCTGPVLTVSTACSSGIVAIAMGLAMLRGGMAETVLVGGVDSLSRLTYFGFHSLQLVDRDGCKPLDRKRKGMAVAEGAGMLLLTTKRPKNPIAELLGAGLSCDAYHPAAPHPEGRGAFMAMSGALADAGLQAEDIGYINLHGTGTVENDLAESKAVRRLFSVPPPLSSIKGASGHSLAAAGALEAVVSAIAISKKILPANTGLQNVDPELGLTPLLEPLERPVKAVLSNSFGFGGNNGSLVIASPDTFSPRASMPQPQTVLALLGYSCLTGAGGTAATMSRIYAGDSAAGRAGLETVSENLPPQLIRRLKRLPRITLALALAAYNNTGSNAVLNSGLDAEVENQKPGAVYMGTGWGALSETHDFLTGLAASSEQFPSPTDFVGSVHNGPAGQVALMFGATGPNITASGGDYSFEQALLTAELSYRDPARPALLLGVDEGHDTFSPLLDASIAAGSQLADGGAAFCFNRNIKNAKCCISMQSRCVLVLAGIPEAMKREGEKQLEQFRELSRLSAPVVHYRKFTGEFASASAVATAFAASFLETGVVPKAFTGEDDIAVDRSGDTILVLGFGQYLTAVKLSRP
jgi:3-oxoacyl-(acyl-carrier-protein) synthase